MSVYKLITKYSDWESYDIKYGAVKTNPRGGKNISILDKSNNYLTIQGPLTFTYGTNKIVDETSGRESFNIAMQHPSEGYGSKSSHSFYEKVKAFEDRFLDDAVKNSKEWFNKQMSREVIEALYSPILKYPYVKGTKDRDYSRAPTQSLKFSYYDGKFSVKLHDMEGNPIFNSKTELGNKQFEDLIPRGSHIAPIIQCKGVWFVGGKFGVSFQVIQAVVKVPERIQDHDECLVRLDDDDLADAKQIVKKEREALEANDEEDDEIDDVAVDDSDAEENNIEDDVKHELESQVEDEEEPEPEPEVKPKRKRVKKKVVAKA